MVHSEYYGIRQTSHTAYITAYTISSSSSKSKPGQIHERFQPELSSVRLLDMLNSIKHYTDRQQ